MEYYYSYSYCMLYSYGTRTVLSPAEHISCSRRLTARVPAILARTIRREVRSLLLRYLLLVRYLIVLVQHRTGVPYSPAKAHQYLITVQEENAAMTGSDSLVQAVTALSRKKARAYCSKNLCSRASSQYIFRCTMMFWCQYETKSRVFLHTSLASKLRYPIPPLSSRRRSSLNTIFLVFPPGAMNLRPEGEVTLDAATYN